MQTDLLITNMNSGQIYKARISSLACEQSVIDIVNEHRCLLLELRRRKLGDAERQRMDGKTGRNQSHCRLGMARQIVGTTPGPAA